MTSSLPRAVTVRAGRDGIPSDTTPAGRATGSPPSPRIVVDYLGDAVLVLVPRAARRH
jgi:hypothetical protein